MVIAQFSQRFTLVGRLAIGATVICWAVAVATGTALLWRHALTAGPAANPQQTWPVQDDLPRSTDAFTLVMTLHPDCPCSRASVAELEILMARCPGRIHAVVLIAQLSEPTSPIESNDLWKHASRIPNVKTITDCGGELTRRFGGETSGQVFLYDAQGMLKFSGGITDGRGHEGDNAGVDAIDAITHGQNWTGHSTPVYGCTIW